MSNRVGTIRRKTRTKLKKPEHLRGKHNINSHLQVFIIGERVQLHIDPTIQKGMYHPKFHGISGIVLGLRGRSVLISIFDGNKQKKVLSHPAHVRKI